MDSRQIKRILLECRNIAVVGLSPVLGKPSHRVAAYMRNHGYRIVPVNPFADKVLEQKSYPSLLDIPSEIQREIDIVDIFRRPEDVQPIVEQAIKLHDANGKPCVVWMQLGIVNKEAAVAAEKADLTVIMDKCMMHEHQRLFKRSSRRIRPKEATPRSQ